MPSLYRKESRADPYDASMRNLRKARASEMWHPLRPWRSADGPEVCHVVVYMR
jgi:hypothetical protein